MVVQQNSELTLWGNSGTGEYIKIVASWSPQDTVLTRGNNRGGWATTIKTPTANKTPHTIEFIGSNTIKLNNVLVGEVWLCSGQSNMEWNFNNGVTDSEKHLAEANYDNIRVFHLPRTAAQTPQDNCGGSWKVATSEVIRGTSAVGYFFARRLSEELDIPVGIIVAAWGGTPAETWIPEEVLKGDPMLSLYNFSNNEWWPEEPGLLYNSMIYPVQPLSIGGAIWYQGEANTGRPQTYARLMKHLIGSWRTAFNSDFPFYLVQIAPFTYGSTDNGPAILREQQELITKQVSNTGMIIVNDLVDNVKDIHPQDKHSVGIRLANMALDRTYSKYSGAYQSPTAKGAHRKGNSVIVDFDGDFKSLNTKGGKVNSIRVRTSDGAITEVSAKVDQTRLVADVSKIKGEITCISYAFDNDSVASIFNDDNIPVAPFRIKVNELKNPINRH